LPAIIDNICAAEDFPKRFPKIKRNNKIQIEIRKLRLIFLPIILSVIRTVRIGLVFRSGGIYFEKN
jgi:hypothetical protein